MFDRCECSGRRTRVRVMFGVFVDMMLVLQCFMRQLIRRLVGAEGFIEMMLTSADVVMR